MNTYPRMLYRAGGPHEIHGGRFDTLIVGSEVEQAAAQADDWHETTPHALAALEKPTAVPDDDAPPTRAELEQKAAELGIKIDGRWSDTRLVNEITKKLGG